MDRTYFVSGIGTGVGKTLVSAIFCRRFRMNYWKPVQTGSDQGTDREYVKKILQDVPEIQIYEELYVFPEPVSPHYAAYLHQTSISPESICLNIHHQSPLIVEGAGGLLVPVSENFFMTDLARKLNIPVVLVISDYLGCINHSLLSFYFLKHSGCSVKGVVLNGNFNAPIRSVILKHNPFPLLAEIPRLAMVNGRTIDDKIRSEEIKIYDDL